MNLHDIHKTHKWKCVNLAHKTKWTANELICFGSWMCVNEKCYENWCDFFIRFRLSVAPLASLIKSPIKINKIVIYFLCFGRFLLLFYRHEKIITMWKVYNTCVSVGLVMITVNRIWLLPRVFINKSVCTRLASPRMHLHFNLPHTDTSNSIVIEIVKMILSIWQIDWLSVRVAQCVRVVYVCFNQLHQQRRRRWRRRQQ